MRMCSCEVIKIRQERRALWLLRRERRVEIRGGRRRRERMRFEAAVNK